jgi:HAD superfamily hydrolase (TIGR01509 family)
MPIHFVAWHATMLRYGIDFDEEHFYELGGVPTDKIITILADMAGLKLDAKAIAHEKELEYAKTIEQLTPVSAVVEIARQHRGVIPMAVATGGERWIAEKSLRKIGVLDWFNAIVTADDVTNHKPHPDVYLLAASRLKVDPKTCCAYEDTDIGLESARRAGMTTIDVRTMYTPRRITKK